MYSIKIEYKASILITTVLYQTITISFKQNPFKLEQSDKNMVQLYKDKDNQIDEACLLFNLL